MWEPKVFEIYYVFEVNTLWIFVLLFLHLSQRVFFPKSYSTKAPQINF